MSPEPVIPQFIGSAEGASAGGNAPTVARAEPASRLTYEELVEAALQTRREREEAERELAAFAAERTVRERWRWLLVAEALRAAPTDRPTVVHVVIGAGLVSRALAEHVYAYAAAHPDKTVRAAAPTWEPSTLLDDEYEPVDIHGVRCWRLASPIPFAALFPAAADD